MYLHLAQNDIVNDDAIFFVQLFVILCLNVLFISEKFSLIQSATKEVAKGGFSTFSKIRMMEQKYYDLCNYIARKVELQPII